MQSSPRRFIALQKCRQIIRATIFLIGGLLSFGLMLAFSFIALVYLRSGAGIELFAFSISSLGVLVGTIHVTGLLIAVAICFCVGVALCAYGLVPPEQKS